MANTTYLKYKTVLSEFMTAKYFITAGVKKGHGFSSAPW
jgi:hypothetical protein